MKSFSNTRLILLHPSLTKHNPTPFSPNRLCVLAFISFFAFVFLLTLLSGRETPARRPNLFPSPTTPIPSSGPAPYLFDALIHYAAQSTAGLMPDRDLRSIAQLLRQRAPCNLLIFGLGPESLLWRALNHGGRTVFIDENQYYIAHYEERNPGLEGYDVAYTTKVSELKELLAEVRVQIRSECRPVQNLLFSDCRLGINDLPNHIYDVAWDVIVVDGPRGYSPESPGRMSSIYTAAVLARSRGEGATDVLVHDYEREVEKVCSGEFLCRENLVGADGQLAHFVIRGGEAARKDDFCFNRTSTAAAAL
ncbi:hypothetical protein KFK09_011605 [Dendrobium nobile]|uniref:Polysaccharide biosynthesis domain-containing protein n=1 Tax=Dendrobium nobile TaxID=94219 RepID=A0A8T3BD19_DENNO|nr:hypothetical protein KFK09_011605 [Dendrobium nobile]